MSLTESLSETILSYAAGKSDSAVIDPKKGYYPFDVIADAYEKGVESGEERLKGKMRQKFVEKAKLTSEAVQRMIENLKNESIRIKAIFIKINFDCSGILMAVDDKTFHSKKFNDLVYGYSSDLKADFFENGLNLEVGFVGSLDRVNMELIQCDGYGIAIDLSTGKALY